MLLVALVFVGFVAAEESRVLVRTLAGSLGTSGSADGAFDASSFTAPATPAGLQPPADQCPSPPCSPPPDLAPGDGRPRTYALVSSSIRGLRRLTPAEATQVEKSGGFPGIPVLIKVKPDTPAAALLLCRSLLHPTTSLPLLNMLDMITALHY